MSAGIGAVVAHVVFWVALAVGWLTEELSPRAALTFIGLWLAGYASSSYVQVGDYLFMSFVALLDVVLLFMVLKGDIRIT